MWMLCLDSSTEWCSVAVGDGHRWHARDELAGQSHSERLLPMARAALAEAGLTLGQLDGLAFGAGPGSFTGIRIGCGVAQGLALGADLPVVAVPTLWSPPTLSHWGRVESGSAAAVGAATMAAAAPAAAIAGIMKRRRVRIGSSFD